MFQLHGHFLWIKQKLFYVTRPPAFARARAELLVDCPFARRDKSVSRNVLLDVFVRFSLVSVEGQDGDADGKQEYE